MYPGIIEAIQEMLYDDKGIFVVDTHSKGTFHADEQRASLRPEKTQSPRPRPNNDIPTRV